jgi:hypothetical protein
MGTARVYKLNSKDEMFNKKITKELDKKEPLYQTKYPWSGKQFVDFTKYCDGKPAKHLSLYQKTSIWGFSNNLIIKFVCEE